MEALSKGLVLGPAPAYDPFSERSQPPAETPSSSEVRWDSRTTSRSLRQVGVMGILIVFLGNMYPNGLLLGTTALLLIVLLLSQLNGPADIDGWTALEPGDVGLSPSIDGLEVADVRGRKLAIGMSMNSAGAHLLGDMGAVIRATDDSNGLCLLVDMKPKEAKDILGEDRFSASTSKFLSGLSDEALRGYMDHRGGMWGIRLAIVGYTRERLGLSALESGFKAAVPDRGWQTMTPIELRARVEEKEIIAEGAAFYGTGEELSKWVVQMASELSSEVGTNVPAEFVAPIRERETDYKLGFIVNPETLKLGPRVGLSHEHLQSGLMVCGGTQPERGLVEALLASELLHAGKRIILVSNDRARLSMTSLCDGGIGLELGKDLVLNPVDSEAMLRSDYVPQLMTALEVLSGTDLRAAVELEVAVNRATSLGNGTVADITIADSTNTSMRPDSETSYGIVVSRASLLGFEAVRSLRQGSGAIAFYGTQTASLQTLADSRLVVIVTSLESSALQRFAWDLLSIKIAGLKPDSNLIVMLDDPDNLRVGNRSFGNRDVWSENIVRKLRSRGPLLIALDHPADLTAGSIGHLSSCLSLRLRDSSDLRVASDLLGLGVIATGLHSKARQSSRETSFLRIMPADMAVLSRGRSEIGIPVKLDNAPSSLSMASPQEMSRRVSRISPSPGGRQTQTRTLLEHVAGTDSDLARSVLHLLTRYEPLTEEAVRKFIRSDKRHENADIEGILARLERANMILRGHELHGGVSYMNFRITMKGTMALRQEATEDDHNDSH